MEQAPEVVMCGIIVEGLSEAVEVVKFQEK